MLHEGEAREDVEVLVVGAGPTGLMLANWLVKLGRRVLVIDGKDGPTVESRALGVHSRSMEIYDQLGVIDRVQGEAVRVESIRQGFEHAGFSPVPLGRLGQGITPYPGLYVLEQSANERILGENLRLLGGSVRWRHRLASLEQVDGGVLAVVGGPDGSSTVRARFAVGCDGASSTVRSLCGTAFEGTTSRQSFYLVDAVGVRGLAPTSINVRLGATAFLLAFPMRPAGDGRTGQRLIGTAGDDDGATVTEEVARRRMAEGFGVTYEDSRWFSTYRVHHRIAAHFRTGSVFLAGDAAHVHSPVGAQGMNTGLQDAHNLAFKLDDVIRGTAPDAFLDRYEAERRPVAVRLLQTTDTVFRGLTSTSRSAVLVRRFVPRVVLPVIVTVLPRLPIGRRLAGYLGQVRIHYRMDGDGPSGGRRRDAVIGRRLPWTGDNFRSLRASAWQLHLYAADDAVLREAEGAAAELGLPLSAFATTRRTPLTPGLLYLVRPDGFVAGAAVPAEAVAAFRTAPALSPHRGQPPRKGRP
ncbi:FAD-dependent monooxygenase [Arthrobacter agilis]|uniref:FAD-dependent monooxygenase n=1 Tax=Arthrobacter agilis TaxID=37921 RepID=UPI00278AC216|nr:FAD-dependent monooxygenase [Arthrobacter agilis]MDQ0736166.1 2-polyprenyl-6-methoxyphenol hydroxylase-like FAD-dependent oxidoreductase [Arthrobacter agilis]